MAAANPVSSPRSSTDYTPSARSSSRDQSSIPYDALEVLRFYREFIAVAPDELTTIFDLSVAPLPFLPEEVHGKPIVMVGACYAGFSDEGAEVVRPLKQSAARSSTCSSRSPTRPCSRCSTLVPHGLHRYWKSVELPPLTDDAIDTLVEHSSAPTSPKSYTIVFQLGGALARVGEDETAFSQRCPQRQHQRGLDRGGSGRRTPHRLGAGLLRRDATARRGARVPELPR